MKCEGLGGAPRVRQDRWRRHLPAFATRAARLLAVRFAHAVRARAPRKRRSCRTQTARESLPDTRAGAAGMRERSYGFPQPPARASVPDLSSQPRRFRLGDVPTEPSHPHRPPPLIGLILRCRLLDQPVVNHARERAIQRSRMEPQTAVSPTLDVFEDVVAVPLAIGERKKNFERHFSQRQQRTRIDWGHRCC